MIESNHIEELVSDYVLGLLPNGMQQKVERHAASCRRCHQAILEEGQLTAAVRTTLGLATAPDPRRLKELMPPARSGRPAWRFHWQRQLAPVGLFILLLLGGWGIWQSNQALIWGEPSPTKLVATATMTEVPEVTMARTGVSAEASPLYTAMAISPTEPVVLATPAPIPTPATRPGGGI